MVPKGCGVQCYKLVQGGMGGPPHCLILLGHTNAHEFRGKNSGNAKFSCAAQQRVCGVSEVPLQLQIGEVLELQCNIMAKWMLFWKEDRSDDVKLVNVIDGLFFAWEVNFLWWNLIYVDMGDEVISRLH